MTAFMTLTGGAIGLESLVREDRQLSGEQSAHDLRRLVGRMLSVFRGVAQPG